MNIINDFALMGQVVWKVFLTAWPVWTIGAGAIVVVGTRK